VNTRVKRLSRSEQQEQTRERLLDAALVLFVERGIDATSIEEVAASAGFSRGAFYSNFATKQDLVMAVSRWFLDVLHAAARPGGADAPDDTGEAYKERLERLRPVAHGGADVFLAEMALYAIRHPESQEEMAALHQAQLVPAMEFMRAQLQKAGVKKPAAVSYETLANIMQALTFGLEFMSKVDPAIEPARTLEIATRALLNGLRPRDDR
jgi:AcrR family transcriptional regulator